MKRVVEVRSCCYCSKLNQWGKDNGFIASHLAGRKHNYKDESHVYHGAPEGRIWNGNWSVAWPPGVDSPETGELRAVSDEFSAALRLKPRKPPVIHGQDGVMVKSHDGENASHYVSLTRLAAEGKLTLNHESFDVTGTAWMDHEFFSQEMGEGQVGWDWMSIQLDDETELMLYRIRASDGQGRDFPAGTYVDPASRARHLAGSDIAFHPGKT